MTTKHHSRSGISRRDTLKLSGLALGGLAVGGAAGSRAGKKCPPVVKPDTQRYSYLNHLEPFCPNTPLEDNEMRITFLGSGFPPPRRAQAEMSEGNPTYRQDGY